MRWADALGASPQGRATRTIRDPSNRQEPNILLYDPKWKGGKVPKAFHNSDWYAWERVPLRLADDYDDWEAQQ